MMPGGFQSSRRGGVGSARRPASLPPARLAPGAALLIVLGLSLALWLGLIVALRAMLD